MIEPWKTEHPSHTARHARAKPHVAWDKFANGENSFYAKHLELLAPHLPQLTATELRVAALCSGQMPTAEMAKVLGISVRTVEGHFRSIRKKIGMKREHGSLQIAMMKFHLRIVNGSAPPTHILKLRHHNLKTRSLHVVPISNSCVIFVAQIKREPRPSKSTVSLGSNPATGLPGAEI